MTSTRPTPAQLKALARAIAHIPTRDSAGDWRTPAPKTMIAKATN